MKLTYAAWGYKDVRSRVLEMAETLIRLPPVRGPRMFGNGMPETVKEAWKDAAPNTVEVRLQPSAGAIARMEECFDWINGYLDDTDRGAIYDYSFIRTRKGMYLLEYLEKNDIAKRTFYDRIERCCQIIADNLNRKLTVRFTMPVDSAAQNQAEHASTTVSSEKCATHWRAPDAKPQIDPDLPSERLIDHRAIRVRHSDKNRGGESVAKSTQAP